MKNLKQFINESIRKTNNVIPVDYDFIANKLFYWDEIIDEYDTWDQWNDEFDAENNPETILSKYIDDEVKAKTMKIYIMPETMDYIKPGVKENQVNIVSESEYEEMVEKFTWKSLIEVYREWTIEVSGDKALRYYNQYGDANNYLIVFE